MVARYAHVQPVYGLRREMVGVHLGPGGGGYDSDHRPDYFYCNRVAKTLVLLGLPERTAILAVFRGFRQNPHFA